MSAATKLLWLDVTIGSPRSLATGDTVDAPGDWTFSEDVVVSGNLTVNGTTTSINTDNVNISDRFTLHNSNYTTDAAVTAGVVFNVDPAATSFSVATVSNAGLAAAGSVLAGDSGFTTTVDPTVDLAIGDIIVVASANDPSNDGIFEVKGISTAPNQVAIKTAPDASVLGIVQTAVVTDAVAGGTLVQSSITILRADSTGGTMSIGAGDATPIVFAAIGTGTGSATLQTAYVNGNTITTSVAEGNISFLGTEDFTVGGSIDVIFNTTGAITLDADVASNFSVAGAGIDLTLASAAGRVVTDGGEAAADAVRITASAAAGGIDIDAGTGGIAADTTGGLSLDSSSVATASNLSGVGAAGVDLTVSQSAGSVVIDGGEAAADAVQITSSNAAGGVDVNGGTGGIALDSTGVISLDGVGASNFTTDTGSLTLATTTSGSVVIDSSGALDVDANGAITIDQDAQAAASGSAGWNGTWLGGTGGTGVAQAGPINAGAGGNVSITSGTGGSSIGGAGAGEGSASGVGGSLGLTGGTGGASDTNLAADPEDASDGGAVNVTGGIGGAAAGAPTTAGQGGDVVITGGDAGATNTGTGNNGGDITIDAGASTGAGIDGNISIGGTNTTAIDLSTASSETVAVLNLINTTNTVGLYTGTSDPSGSVTALAGSFFLRDTGTGAEAYLNTSTTSGTSWALLATAAGSVSLQTAYDTGNTILVSIAEGGAVAVSGTVDEANTLLSLTGGAHTVATAEVLLSMTNDADSTGDALFINNLGSGDALQVQDGGADVLLISGAGAVSLTPTSGQNGTITVAGAGILDIDAGAGGIDITSTGNIAITAPAASATAWVLDDGTTAALTLDSTAAQLELGMFLDTGDNVGQGLTYANNSGGAIAAGKIVSTDTNTTLQIITSDATGGGATNLTSRVTGVAVEAIANAASGKVNTTYGVHVDIVFTGAVATTDIGKVAYLDTTGNATITIPSASGDFVVEVGIVQGANAGAGTVARVLFQPRFVAAIA